MSARYIAVQWNTHKRVYDLVLWAFIILFVAAFVAFSKATHTGANAISDEILVLRGLGLTGFALLTVILCVGPLARLDARFMPLLYNRRHLGVSMALLGLLHGAFAFLYYGGFGVTDPFSALLARPASLTSLSAFPFEWPGFLALLILVLMAATSHDFWLSVLPARVWKTLHTLVYAAYALLCAHIALGSVQSEPGPLYPVMLAASIGLVGTLHILAAWTRAPIPTDGPADGWLDAGPPDDIPHDRARGVRVPGADPIAVYRYTNDAGEDCVSAIHGVCAHQGGPLTEGRVVNGCVTCPWHGYQYRPEDACSPPPYTETLPTYKVRVRAGRVEVNPEPLEPGTRVEPARTGGATEPGKEGPADG